STEFRGAGPESSIGTGPNRDVLLHRYRYRYRYRSLPRTKGFRTASPGCPERTGRTRCIARLDSATACLVADPALRWGDQAKPGSRPPSFQLAVPQARSEE